MKNNVIKFKQFLQKNNVEEEYFSLLTSVKQGGAASEIGKYKSPSQFFEREPEKDWVINAFYFFTDSEKSEKWIKLSIKWNLLLETKRIQVYFPVDKFLKVKETAKELGVTPEKFIELSVDNYIEEINLNLQKAKEQ